MRSIRISIPDQTLELTQDGKAIRCYPVSTSKNGVGEKYGSFRTPRGRHIIRAKVGTDAPVNTVFIKRRPTGEIYDAELGGRFPGRDWMLTRLLWLSGCEPGFNRLRDVDTMRRYIYIHGSPDTTLLGKPGSIGCIRMHNCDIMELFELVEAGTPVEIAESPL